MSQKSFICNITIRKTLIFWSVSLFIVSTHASAGDQTEVATLTPDAKISAPDKSGRLGRFEVVPLDKNGWATTDSGGVYFVEPKDAKGENVSQKSPPLDLLEAARRGDSASQYKLGMLYYDGVFFPKNYIIASMWLFKAADQGYIDAQGQLGFMYMNGYGVQEDHLLAYKWLSLASTSGNQNWVYYKNRIEALIPPKYINTAQAMASEWSPFARADKQALANP